MKQEVQVLLEIIKYYLNKNYKTSFEVKAIEWEKLISIAAHHNVLNIVYHYVEELELKKNLSDKAYQYLVQKAMYEITKSYNQIYAAEELFETFEKQEICALAVKGICAKCYFPQYDMRSMGDIDILYKSKQHQKLKSVMKQLGYKQKAEGRKHDCYIREPFVAVEMHRELVATDSEYNAYYKNVWSRLKQKENHQFVYEMSLEDEYIYSLIHLVEHFKNGGVGIRFVMDVYIYNKMENMNWDYIEKELKQLELWKFYQNISSLAEMWFGIGKRCNEVKNEHIDKLANYIISNGVMGSLINSASIAITKEGRNVFFIKAIFPNFQNMQSMFPWLKKHPYLLPYSWVLRGFKSIVFRRTHIKTQISRYRYGDKTYGEELKKFFKTCGL